MKTKEPKEEVIPQKCVCGHTPVVVKHRSKYMCVCTNTLHCTMRGLWFGKEEQAIKSYNTAVDEARYRRAGNV